MGKGFLKINPTSLVPQWRESVIPTHVDDTNKVSFNFMRLKSKENKFVFADNEKQYFLKLIERLKCVCGFTRTELMTNRSKSLRCHPIDFNDAKCSERTFGIANDVDDDAYQIEISEHEHGRIHGYFVENVFHVVWLDAKHQLYA